MNIDYKLLMDSISTFCFIFSIIYAGRQIEMTRTSNSLSSILYIQKENFEVRKKIHDSEKQIKVLLDFLSKEKNSFLTSYSKKEFDEIREFGYHYELIGLLVKNKSLKFDTIFELIPFPDEFWDKSTELRFYIRQNHFKDFWINFEYLRKLYIKKRSLNKLPDNADLQSVQPIKPTS